MSCWEREKSGLKDGDPRKKIVGPASTGQTGRPYRSDWSGQTDKKDCQLMVYYLGLKLMTLFSLIAVN